MILKIKLESIFKKNSVIIQMERALHELNRMNFGTSLEVKIE